MEIDTVPTLKIFAPVGRETTAVIRCHSCCSRIKSTAQVWPESQRMLPGSVMFRRLGVSWAERCHTQRFRPVQCCSLCIARGTQPRRWVQAAHQALTWAGAGGGKKYFPLLEGTRLLAKLWALPGLVSSEVLPSLNAQQQPRGREMAERTRLQQLQAVLCR